MRPEPLAVWGGVEATVTRVGDRRIDQIRLTGHHDRIDDLDRFAALGLAALRQPVLWERTELAPGRFDWRWPDARMARLRALGLAPIVGLVHHGCGPDWTGLLDDGFAPGLAAFAARAARRYPWARDWTPVNEPLTTARFCALYGFWRPHLRDERAFWLALLNQIDATRLAMRAIRREIPGARLVQTEDFGRTHATDPCRAQAEFENHRRAMTWDLLCGMVVPGHPLHDRVAGFGFADRLRAIADDPCPPDVVGMNHYVTSDRFLDHRLSRYPAASHGGNGLIAYADVEAVRVLSQPVPRWEAHLATLWARYGLPLAVTECHLACTREEQLRWFAECWDAASAARAQGARVEAVTVWALLGACGWDSLLRDPAATYESGAFDVSDGAPRPTALAALVAEAARTGRLEAPIARQPGWWRRDERFVFPCPDGGRAEAARTAARRPQRPAAEPFRLRAAHPRADAILALCRLRGLHVELVHAAEAAPPHSLIEPPGHLADSDEIHRHLDLMLDRRPRL